VHYLEHLVPFWWRTGDLAQANHRLLDEIVWARDRRPGGLFGVMRRCRRPGIAVAIVLALTTAAHAESSLDAIRARGVLRVGVKSDAPPFGSLDAFGRRVGFEIDLARLFARVLFDDDWTVEFVPVTTATRFEVLEAGRVDLVAATITVTEEASKAGGALGPVLHVGVVGPRVAGE
jgi:ABC-type amino acid transport substrate-binding protein